MYSQALFFYTVIYYSVVCVQCTTIFVATTPVNPINRDSRDRWKFLVQDLPAEEEPRPTGWKFPGNFLYGDTSMGGWVDNGLFEKFGKTKAEGTVLFSADECSRYCIGNGSSKNDDHFQYINLLWMANITDITVNLLSNGFSRLMPEINDMQSSNNNLRKCQIYLDLDCNTPETEIPTNYTKNVNKPNFQSSVILAERYNLSENTEIKFMVDIIINRIIIHVDGNVSKVMLRIPTTSRYDRETMISWTRKGYADGVRIDTRNPPSGEWWMKFVRDDNSEYHFNVEGFVDVTHASKLFSPEPTTNENSDAKRIPKHHSNIKIKPDPMLNIGEKSDDILKTINPEVIKAEQHDLDATNNSKLVDDRQINRERLLKRRTSIQEQSDQAKNKKTFDNESSVIATSTDDEFINYAEYVTFMDYDRNETIPKRFNDDNESVEKIFAMKEQENIHARSSADTIENLDIDNNKAIDNLDISVRKIETLDNEELSEDLVNYANQNIIEEKKMLIEVNRNSNLLVTPGTIHRIVFDVLNGCILPVRYSFRVKSTLFRVYNVQPPYAWIYPGQMTNVAVDLVVPNNAALDTANTVTFSIQGTEIKEKSVYLYVQGSVSKLTDDVKPKIEYSFNSNCAGKLGKDRCYKSHWSMDITIQDYDSGLKRVISSPRNIYPRTEFISGMRSPVTFYYSATCCDTTAKITAIDLLDNFNTYTIDVTAWNNLSEAEIAAITVGTLLALLFIILIVILIIYCCRRKKSHDLPYSQRYGSRSPPSAERTNF